VKAEQPTTTYAEFKKEILNEIARCLNIPFNVAAGNSSGYNYASGRLDHQVYFKQVRLDQSEFGRVILDRLLEAWFEEALLVGLLPAGAATQAEVTHQWFWDGPEHVDPTKEASADQTRLQDNTTTLADIYGRKGQDWEIQIRQRAREVALVKQLGLAPVPTKPDATPPGGGPDATPPKDEKPPEDAGDEVPEPPWAGEEGDAAGCVGAGSPRRPEED
jgi:capsid protein